MSTEISLFKELKERCQKENADYETISKDLKNMLIDEVPLAYYFGIGMAPENPTTMIDIIIITQESVITYNIQKDKIITSGRGKRSIYNHFILVRDAKKVKILITTEGLFSQGYYVNNPLEEESKAWKFNL